jgi:wyosine [tRNA(Phe)-imidazoG37] synthetase (radical SAM superfamily)
MITGKGKGQRYTYGPVPSRRLGLSLGVDIVPMKVCTLDCVYCQLGRTTEKSTVRRDFVDIEAVLVELHGRLQEGVQTDYITLAGSGEPTLNSRLGELIDRIHAITQIPVAVLTNGTLFYRDDVRAECGRADVVIPSLDAGDEATFEAVNRPARDISIEKLVSGLVAFREEFSGRIWLEVFLVPGINTDRDQIEKIKALVQRIRPDKVQLNTAVRPAAEKELAPADARTLAEIAHMIGDGCEIIADVPVGCRDDRRQQVTADVLSMLKRRPCSLDDLCAGLGISRDEAAAQVHDLQEAGRIFSEPRGTVVYFRAAPHLRG